MPDSHCQYLGSIVPTALRLPEIQGIPGSLAWCGNLATRALLGCIARVHILDNDEHDVRHPILGFKLL